MMFYSWNRLMWISGWPFIYFIGLFLLSYLIFNLFFRIHTLKIESGAIIMALGVYAMACLPVFRIPYASLMVLALELLIIWLFLATALIHIYVHDGIDFAPYNNRMALGTWVAGTAITALLLDQAESALLGFIILLAIVAVMVWVVYLIIILKWLLHCLRKQFRVFANGLVLLGTVATQSTVLLFLAFFHDDVPASIYQIIIGFGFVFYWLALYAILRHLFSHHQRHLIANWSNVNCIIHGAMAITGFAMLNAESFSPQLIVLVWWWTLICFLVVEGMELCRLILRVKMKGIKKGVFVYKTSQWSRVFTFGMFYAFTIAFYHQQSIKNPLIAMIANYGEFVVTVLLLFEIFLCFKYLIKHPLSTNIQLLR